MMRQSSSMNDMSHAANFGHSAQPQPTLSPRSIDQRIRAIQGSLLSAAASADSRKKGCEHGDDSAESADVGNRRVFENTSWQQAGGGQSRESFRKTTNTKGLTLNIDSCIKGQLRRWAFAIEACPWFFTLFQMWSKIEKGCLEFLQQCVKFILLSQSKVLFQWEHNSPIYDECQTQ